MRTALVAACLAFAVASLSLAGCLGSTEEPGPGGGDPDLAGPVSTDMAHGGGGNPDLAGGGGGTMPLGADCTVDGDCASGMCRQFRMGAVHFCTVPCAVATQTTDCPVPPTAGTCTNNGYCRFN
jgi:hypothetical protein